MSDLPQGLVTRPAIELLGSLVPIRNPVIRIADDDSIEGEVQQTSLSCQLGISSLSVGDIARHCKLHETLIGHSQRSCMCLHAACYTLKSHDVEFERTSLASTNSFIESPKPLAVGRSNQVVDILANDHLCAIGSNHP